MAKATSEALLTKQVRQQDANPTVRRPYGQSSPKWEKFIPDGSRTAMRSFTPLSFPAAEKPITVQTKKGTVN